MFNYFASFYNPNNLDKQIQSKNKSESKPEIVHAKLEPSSLISVVEARPNIHHIINDDFVEYMEFYNWSLQNNICNLILRGEYSVYHENGDVTRYVDNKPCITYSKF